MHSKCLIVFQYINVHSRYLIPVQVPECLCQGSILILAPNVAMQRHVSCWHQHIPALVPSLAFAIVKCFFGPTPDIHAIHLLCLLPKFVRVDRW
jgi:hypothetical protein